MLIQISEFSSIMELIKAFPDEQSCITHLELLRWNGEVISPFDPTSTVYACSGNRYKCRNSNKYFSVRTGTIFEDSKLPLQKWFMALYLFASHKKGISSHQLGRDLGCTQKTAWFILHRLRYAFDHPEFKKAMDNVVEVDETYIGGKEKNKHKDKKIPGSQGRSTKSKTAVLGMMERGGNIVAMVVPNANQNIIIPYLRQYIKKGAVVCTDEHRGYACLPSVYHHAIVNHAARQYVDENGASTNCMENFWSHLKRGILGIYHQTSKFHLQSYIDEFCFRFNTREYKASTRFNMVLQNAIGRRLTYEQLISN